MDAVAEGLDGAAVQHEMQAASQSGVSMEQASPSERAVASISDLTQHRATAFRDVNDEASGAPMQITAM